MVIVGGRGQAVDLAVNLPDDLGQPLERRLILRMRVRDDEGVRTVGPRQ